MSYCDDCDSVLQVLEKDGKVYCYCSDCDQVKAELDPEIFHETEKNTPCEKIRVVDKETISKLYGTETVEQEE
ncbi:MAG: hypothetical protein INQ03_18185 [Candidatus Heimdallarchaeota archaeon]|nr:hypothetical protein [Candidatus Heimdallarchaeota archaeon]